MSDKPRTRTPRTKAYTIQPPVKIGFDGKVIPSSAKDRVKYWKVTLSARATGTKKQRFFFDTEREASEWVKLKQAEIGKRAVEAFAMPDETRRLVLAGIHQLTEKNITFQDAVKASLSGLDDGFKPDELVGAGRLVKTESKRLEKLGLSITAAVDYCLSHYRPPEKRKHFAEVMEIFLKDREGKGCRPKTLNGYRSHSRTLVEEYGEVDIDQIAQSDIEDWLTESEYQPRTRKNYLQTLTTVFHFAIKRKWCNENTASHVSRPILDDKPPGILTVPQARALLASVQEHQPEHIPGIAIGLFAGLRVSELLALDWSEIHLDRRLIEVKAAKAKTRQRRLVRIKDNLALWLAPYVQTSGPVLYREEDGIREPLGPNRFNKDLRWLVGSDQDCVEPLPVIVSPWPTNAIRHSFGSYYFGESRNENETAAEMGNSPAMVFKHYRELVAPEAVTDYWNIKPTGEATNVIPMTASSAA